MSQISKRWLRYARGKPIIGVVLSALLLSACGSSSSANAKAASPTTSSSVATTITWGETVPEVTWVSASLAYLIAHPTLMNKYHINIKLSAFQSGGPMYDAFRGGKLDLMDAGADSVAQFSEQGIPLVAVKAWNTLPSDWAIAVKASSPYTSISQLKGLSYASGTTNGTDWFSAGLVFEKNGINPSKDLKVVTLPPPSIYDSIVSGKVAAGWLVDGLVTKGLQTKQIRVLTRIGPYISQNYTFPYFFLALTSNKQFFAKHPNSVKNAEQAVSYVMKNVSIPKLAAAALANKSMNYTVTLAQAEQTLTTEKPHLVINKTNSQIQTELLAYYKGLYKLGAFSKPINSLSFWHFE